MNILQSMSQFKARAVFTLQKRSPELCMAGGFIMFGVTVFLACRQTIKAEKPLTKYAEDKEMIDAVKAEVADRAAKEAAGEEIEEDDKALPTVDEIKKEEVKMTKDLIVGMAKNYWPVALCGAISATFFLTSYKIINGRFVGVLGAYTALDEGFKKYRERVKDEVGEEAEREIFTGVKKKPGFVRETDEDGSERIVEEEVPQINEESVDDLLNGEGPRVFLFSRDTSLSFQPGDGMYNRTFIKQIEDEANRELFGNGYIFERDVLRMLGLKPTPESCLRGWIIDPANPPKNGSHPICFHMQQIFRETGDTVLSTGRVVKALSGRGFILEMDSTIIWNLIDIWEHSNCGIPTARRVVA